MKLAWVHQFLPLAQTGSECAAASSRCPPAARKWPWRRRQYWGWRPHRDCRSRRSPWPPGPRSGPACSPGRSGSSSRNSAPITEAGTHLHHTQTHTHTHKEQVRPAGSFCRACHYRVTRVETGPAAVQLKLQSVWMLVGAKRHLKSDLTSEMAVNQPSEKHKRPIVSRGQLCCAARSCASPGVHPPSLGPLTSAGCTSCSKHTPTLTKNVVCRVDLSYGSVKAPISITVWLWWAARVHLNLNRYVLSHQVISRTDCARSRIYLQPLGCEHDSGTLTHVLLCLYGVRSKTPR